jgi:hypothetical protein
LKTKDGKKNQEKVLILGTSAEIEKIVPDKSIEDIKILKRSDVIKDLKRKFVSIKNKPYRINCSTRLRNLIVRLFWLVILTHFIFGFMCAIMSPVTMWRLTLFLNIPFFYVFSWLCGFVILIIIVIIIRVRKD